MSNVTPINPDTSDPWDDTPDGIEPPPLIPQGDYHVVYVSHEYFEAFDKHKARVTCEITKGKFAGTMLERFYNVRFDHKHCRPPRSERCHYRIEMRAMTGNPAANLKSLRGLDLIATVKTVTRDSQGNLPLSHQSSLIKRLQKA